MGASIKSKIPHIIVKKSAPKPTVVFRTYWKFAVERQNVFFRRLSGQSYPWTSDPIIHDHKFTNAYRASDRVSQFFIKEVIYGGPQDTENIFFRTLLFKIFNKIETWNSLKQDFGEISCKNFQLDRYTHALNKIVDSRESIYSAAYIMPSGGKNSGFPKKHMMHLHLIRKMINDGLPGKIEKADSMQEVFNLLKSYPTIGDFLAYQFATDLNYSDMINFSEMEFVVPGPGARNGIKKCFSSLGDHNESELIRFVTENQESELSKLGLHFENLGGRTLQLIDCQNLFCETDKYSRVAHPEFKGVTDRTRIKQKFSTHGDLERPFYPPKWGINSKLSKQIRSFSKENMPVFDLSL